MSAQMPLVRASRMIMLGNVPSEDYCNFQNQLEIFQDGSADLLQRVSYYMFEQLFSVYHFSNICFMQIFSNYKVIQASEKFFLILKSIILICVSKHEPPSHLPPHNISVGLPHAPAPSKHQKNLSIQKK